MLGTIVLVVVGLLLAAVLVLWLYGERWRLLRGSSWSLLRQAGARRVFSSLHAYVYGRWIKEYVTLLIRSYPRMSPRTKKWWSDHYHGKVLTHEQAEGIITVEQDVPLRDLEQVIPYPVARDLVLTGPPDVAVFQCGCRQSRAHPCQPIEVCMVIGQPFVDFVLEHHPRSSRRLTQAEALELLRAEHERGHVHSAWFKDATLGRFYVICNCCKCCCGGIEAMVKHGVPMMASSGYVAQVDEARCAACATCEDVCPFEAIHVDGTAQVDWAACMGCGVCVAKCPDEAVVLVRDERKAPPLDVRLLAQEPVEGSACEKGTPG